MKKYFVPALMGLVFAACGGKSTGAATEADSTATDTAAVEAEATEAPKAEAAEAPKAEEKKVEKPKQQGPCHIANKYYEFDVPEGWYVDKENAPERGSIASYTIKSDNHPDEPTNFGWDIEFWGFGFNSSTAEKYVDEFLNVFKEGKKMSDLKVGSNKFKHAFFKEHGSTQVLAVDYPGEGALRITVHSYDVNDANVQAVLKSLKLNKVEK